MCHGTHVPTAFTHTYTYTIIKKRIQFLASEVGKGACVIWALAPDPRRQEQTGSQECPDLPQTHCGTHSLSHTKASWARVGGGVSGLRTEHLRLSENTELEAAKLRTTVLQMISVSSRSTSELLWEILARKKKKHNKNKKQKNQRVGS